MRASRPRKTCDRAVYAIRVNALERGRARPPILAVGKDETDAINGIRQRLAALGLERKDARHLGYVFLCEVCVGRVIVAHDGVQTMRRRTRSKH